LWASHELEIIVVNAGSPQGERYILREYLDKIVYIESLREPIYQSWNRGLAIATGELCCNANADDRLRPDALEVMAAVLDGNPAVGLVYADAIVVASENATWGGEYEVSTKAPYYGKIQWPEYEPKLLTQFYLGGPNPMYRRSLHAQYGAYDDSFQLAGDLEWALRLAANGVVMQHIPQELILFYDNGAGINNPEQSGMEARRAMLRWKGMIK